MQGLKYGLVGIALMFGHQAAIAANAAKYPDIAQTVQIVVPLAPGNAVDAGARALAMGMAKETGKNFVVVTKPGAGGTIGTADVARGPKDGSVLLFMSGGHTTNPALYSKLPYDTVADFKPLTMVSRSQGFVLLVRNDGPFKTVKDLVEAARKAPGALSYGSFGNGNTTHVMGALFARAAGVNLMHVPYKSPINDFLGGHVDMIFIGMSSVKPLVDTGKVRALAVSSDSRLAGWPDLPTFKELGYGEVGLPAWSGMFAPSGVPDGTMDQLYAAAKVAVQSEDYQKLLRVTGSDLIMNPPAEFGPYVADEVELYAKLLPSLGIRLD